MPRTIRKARRFSFGQGGTLHASRGKVVANVKVRDISTSGCELEYTAGLNLGTNCELYFDWQDTYIGLEAQAVWKKEAQGRAGLRFRKVDKQTQQRLDALCTELSRQRVAAPEQDEAAEAPAGGEPASTPQESHPAFPLAAPPKPPSPGVSTAYRRGVPRYASDKRGTLLNPATGAVTDVKLVELSVCGCRVQGSPLPEAGQNCEVRTESSSGGELVLQGEVKWKSERELGLKFISPDEETVNQLREICRNLRLLPPSRTV